MGIKKNTIDAAFVYARQRARELGSVQRIIEVDGGYRVGGEKRMSFYYPDTPGWTVYPIY